MSGARYAVFFVPPADSALYRFGAAALGYDAYSGGEVPSLADDHVGAAEWHALTAEPRRYGFHATLKPPFHLRAEYAEDDLVAEFAVFARHRNAPPEFAASIRTLGSFTALVPSAPAPAVNALADDCVRGFDRFREPPTEAERDRRLAHKLTSRQIDHLDRWGYPYVFEDFRFHMTLSGRLPAARTDAVLALLRDAHERAEVPATIAIEAITVLRQDRADARFRVIHQASLSVAHSPIAASRHDFI